MTWHNRLDKTRAAQGIMSGLSAQGNVQERGGRVVKTDERMDKELFEYFLSNLLSRGMFLKNFETIN